MALIRPSPVSLRKNGHRPRAGAGALLEPDGRARHSPRMSGRHPASKRPGGRQARWYRGTAAGLSARGDVVLVSREKPKPREDREGPPMTYPKASASQAGTSQAQAGNGSQDSSGGVPASPRFPAIEEDVLAYWEADDTFRASVANRPEGED